MKNNNFTLSDTASIHINILRVFSIQTIAFCHGLENIAAIPLDNPIGVSGFTFLMLISGFLIAYSIIKGKRDKNYDFKRYFLRRFSRIYPVLLIGFIVIIFFDWLNKYKFLENIDIFLINIILLNNSVLGFPYYGFNRHLWFLPLFWYMYLLFGWLLLGLRTTKRNYFLYIIILALFSLIIIIICLGTQTTKKINYIIIWILSAVFLFLMIRLNTYIEKKSLKNNFDEVKRKNQLKKKVKYVSLAISTFLFIMALLRGIYFKFDNPYELVYNLFLTGAVFFLLIISQYTDFIYPKKVKKALNFIASYSFTLFLIHVAVFNFLLKPFDNVIYFIIIYINVNILSFIIAYFTEMKSEKIYHYLLKLFGLETKTQKLSKNGREKVRIY